MSNTYVQLLLNSTGETVSALQLWTALAMAHKAEHAVDLEAGAVVAVTLAAADAATILETVLQGGEYIAEVAWETNNQESGPALASGRPGR